MVKDIETLNGNKRAFAIYNPNEAAKQVSLSFRDIDLGGTVALRDVFQRKDLGTFTDTYEVSVPKHATRIYVAEATQRLERTRYEAETAYISDYQELKNNQTEKTGVYDASDICSAGYKAGWLGQSERNDLQWRDIYSAEGGEYELTIAYISGENRNITISVNGKKVKTASFNSGGWQTVGRKTFTVQLEPGLNTVRLSNATGWMPDIDYMDLVSKKSLGIEVPETRETESAAAYDLLGRPIGLTPSRPPRGEASTSVDKRGVNGGRGRIVVSKGKKVIFK
jgi:hypothetical protein